MKKSSRYVCITLDLEPDHAGLIPWSYEAWRGENIEELLTILKEYRIPLSIFVVGKTLRDQPRIVRKFMKYGAQFHLHSHTHSFSNPDGENEILRGKQAFHKFFGRYPTGYRAPAGRISPAGLARLEQAEFFFDASVFPTIWPSIKNILSTDHPHRPLPGRGIIEVPFTTITPLRLVTSLSWMKLFDWPMYRELLTLFTPQGIVFGMHLHDLWPLSVSRLLPYRWRWVYHRNRTQGLQILRSFIQLLQERGYEFLAVGELVKRYQASDTSDGKYVVC